MLRLVGFLAAALACAGCTETVTIEPGCGNYVLEDGEDCDTPEASCTSACRLVCDPRAQQPSCPAGMACGANGECRAPSGTFGAPIVAPFEVQRFSVTDLDDDLADDLLGASSGNIIALYGATDVPLATRVVRSVPLPTGPAAIGDYTGDRRPDLIVPIRGGLFAFETSTGVPEPVVFPTLVTHGAVYPRSGMMAFGVPYRLVESDVGGVREVRALVGGATSGPRPCNIAFDLPRLAGRTVRPYVDRNFLGIPIKTMIPMVIAPDNPNDPAQTPTICIEIEGSGGDAAIPLPRDGRGNAGNGGFPIEVVEGADAFFAELDAAVNGCPELIVNLRICDLALTSADTCSEPDTELVYALPGSGAGGSCTIAGSNVRAVLGPAYAMVHHGAVRALVTPHGVLDPNLFLGMPPLLAPPPGIFWNAGVAGDFDGNGLHDFAVTSVSVNAGFLDDISVYEQYFAASWRTVRVPTTGFLYSLAAGDFDGDGKTDLAWASLRNVIELFLGDAAPDADISVAYANESAFTAPVRVTSVGDLYGFSAAPVPDPINQLELDRYDDLVLGYGGQDAGDAGKLSVLFGNANRQLLAPKLDSVYGRFATAAEIGGFADGGGQAVFAVFRSPTDEDGSGSGGIRSAGVRFVQGTDTLDVAGPEILPERKGNAFAFITNPISITARVGSRDVMLAFHNRDGTTDHCASYYAPGSATMNIVACADLIGAAPAAARDALLNVEDVYAAGDGTLIVTSEVAGESYVYRWTIGEAGGVPRLSDPVDLVQRYRDAGGTLACYRAVTGELGTDVDPGDGTRRGEGAPEIVYACGREDLSSPTGIRVVLAALYAGAGGGDRIVELAELDRPFTTIRIADLDADGLDDIITHEYSGSVRAFLQCEKRTPCN